MSDRLLRVEQALEERRRRRLEVDVELRRLFGERQNLDDEIEGLTRALSVATGIADVEIRLPDGGMLALETKAVARRGSLIGTVADILRVEGRGLHADKIVQRLEALGMSADKKALVAQLSKRAAAGGGFKRTAPNTFYVVIAAPVATDQEQKNEAGTQSAQASRVKEPARSTSDVTKRTRGARHHRR